MTPFQTYMSARREHVIRLRAKGLTLEQIGCRLGVTREQARHLSQPGTKKSMEYLKRIRALPCLCCGRVPSEAAHVRYSEAKAGKVNPGFGAKPEDRWCVPLCSGCHRGLKGQHTRGEHDWWVEKGVDPIFIALALWGCKAEYEAGCKIVRHAYFHS